jgi:glycosidase
MEFHISRTARDRYQFDEGLFSLSGNVILANFHAARTFAQKMNQTRDLVRFPEQAIKSGQINAMGLLDEILHYVFQLYRQQAAPTVMPEALTWLEEKLGPKSVDGVLRHFADEFPALRVYRQEESLEVYLAGETDGVPNRQVVLEEMILLWLANANPAMDPYLELFDDANLTQRTAYKDVIEELRTFFETKPRFGPEHENLIDLLRSPAVTVPHSLPGQLEYIRQKWGLWLGKYLFRLLSSLDFIKEEEKASFFGPGPAQVYDYGGLETESERFSEDREWMPQVVLMAKNTYVWLDQLSRKYQQSIYRLDQIPDEELDQLEEWGFTGLWFIGLWERSKASKQIKQLCGNPEAVASAYSLNSYDIAGDLGGEEAFRNLRRRAWQRGIRLASDMVPNHMAVDSPWVVNNPDWFLSLDHSPFPSYSFNGPDVSADERVGVFIEDHYYDRTDAAVVFKRLDRWTGDVRYVYHGNDGTNMPWNDTAQLDYLNPNVREAVIQTILHVARLFPIIRFDAAMTLAKKHYQRLWFPEPGSGGDIPTRAEYSMTKAEFNNRMPKEFWREVVDRVAQEVPDTLLLAEAFWLMEGYFVRTLGMHRVYNSAFMNMLRNEENANYRSTIKNTIEFDPEILKRFVNFMNNPDERTAVDQFGKGDKYFGICTMMATMPGLPMFGHGQIEGYTEKYGMEYRRAYWDEAPDTYLVERHRREIFPLLRLRHLFAEVRHFLLYDFYTPDGYVNEDVFAYSNQSGQERSLVVYHNRFASAQGWIKESAAHSVKADDGDSRVLVRKTLGEALGIHADDRHFCIFRDQISGLEFIRRSRQLYEQGLYVELDAYKCHVFLDFREVEDDSDHHYAHLSDYLNGRGVPSVAEALKEILLQPVHVAFKALANQGMLQELISIRELPEAARVDVEAIALESVRHRAATLLEVVKQFAGGDGSPVDVADNLMERVSAALHLPGMDGKEAVGGKAATSFLKAHFDDTPNTPSTLFAWLLVASLGEVVEAEDSAILSRSLIDEWRLGRIIAQALVEEGGLDEGQAWRAVTIIKVLTTHQNWHQQLQSEKDTPSSSRALSLLRGLLNDADVRGFLQINRYQDILWFNNESFDELLQWLLTAAVVEIRTDTSLTGEAAAEAVDDSFALVMLLQQASDESGFQVEKLLELVR